MMMVKKNCFSLGRYYTALRIHFLIYFVSETLYIVKKKQYSSNFQSVDVGQETRVTSETLNVTIRIDVVSVVLFG